MKRFTAYRFDIDKFPEHTELHKNQSHEPQFEGVIFSDGTCAIHWVTPIGSTSFWKSLDDLLEIHGHVEYGTYIVWHDHEKAPDEWLKRLDDYARVPQPKNSFASLVDKFKSPAPVYKYSIEDFTEEQETHVRLIPKVKRF